jgi:hypothetical protein
MRLKLARSIGALYRATRAAAGESFALDPPLRLADIRRRDAHRKGPAMSTPNAPAGRRINWPSVITVCSAVILIGAEVFGIAYAGGWALATLFGFDEIGQRIVEGAFVVLGIYIMYSFIRNAQRVEPFMTRD